MGVGLYLAGSYGGLAEYGPEEWLERVASWLGADEGEPLVRCFPQLNGDGKPALAVSLHPSAEDLEIVVPEPGRCLFEAKTSTTGPGYHIHLCQRIAKLAENFAITWDEPEEAEGDTSDETGYFFGGDAGQVREEMLRWLQAVAALVVKQQSDPDQTVMISMPLGHHYTYSAPVLTPLGPRTLAWFEEVRENPQRGIAFFPWWEEGLTASFFLGRALCRMWQEVRWRPPLNEDETQLLSEVHQDLERAYHLEPARDLPWREWAEILDYLEAGQGFIDFRQGEELADIIRKEAALAEDGPRIGYRRAPVVVTLSGGWSVKVPGDFAEEWDEEGENWSAWHGGKTVWFSSLTFQAREGEQTPSAQETLEHSPLPDGEKFYEHVADPVYGEAVLLPFREEGEQLWQLRGHSAIPGGLALCNIFFRERDDLAWALATWRSVRHQGELQVE